MPKLKLPEKEPASTQYNFRIGPKRLEIYKRSAGKLELSKWILDACDAHAIRGTASK